MKRIALILLVMVLGYSVPLFAQDGYFPEDIQRISQENAQLKERVEALEKALLDVQDKLVKEDVKVEAAAPKAADKAPEKPAVRSKYNLEFYGYIKGDASKDDSEGSLGSFFRWVNREDVVDNDSHFNITSNESRFGFLLNGPKDGKTNVSGNLEFDLFGTERPENRSNVALRHAFLKVDWVKDEWSLIAGQTWDLIGFGVPGMLNYSPVWWGGNIGYRRPQIRLGKAFTYDKSHKLQLEAGAFRTMGNTGPFTLNDTGDDASSPSFQGRVAYTFPGFNKKATTVAVSGLSGKEEVDTLAAGGDLTAKIRATAFNLDLPLWDKFALKGEIWNGENVDTYLAGIGQGVVMTASRPAAITRAIDTAAADTLRVTNVQTIKSRGHWLNLSIGPFGKWNYGIGISTDNPENDILPAGSRADNSSRWLNAIYNLNEAVQMGIEFSRWETGYIGFADATNNRIQTSVIYRF